MRLSAQGINVLPIQRAINQLRSSLYPSLSSSFDRLASDDGTQKPRSIGFISTWFRVHSVGKLLLGIVQNLDRNKFHVTIYRCVHFLSDSDDVTEKFKRAADEYVELPDSQDAAVTILRQAKLDVAIFPELGMDEWTVLLSHHRVAPIQCVFWGTQSLRGIRTSTTLFPRSILSPTTSKTQRATSSYQTIAGRRSPRKSSSFAASARYLPSPSRSPRNRKI